MATASGKVNELYHCHFTTNGIIDMAIADQSTPESSPARDHVFSLPELLEMILLRLPNRDLASAHTVCDRWQTIIDKSKQIQRALCRLRISNPRPASECGEQIPKMTSPNTTAADFLSTIDGKGHSLNPFFSSYFKDLKDGALVEMRYDFDKVVADCRDPFLKSMYLTQPPATKVQFLVEGWVLRDPGPIVCEDNRGVTVSEALREFAYAYREKESEGYEIRIADEVARRTKRNGGRPLDFTLRVFLRCEGIALIGRQ